MLAPDIFISNVSLQIRLHQDDNKDEMGKGDEKPALQVIVLVSSSFRFRVATLIDESSSRMQS